MGAVDKSLVISESELGRNLNDRQIDKLAGIAEFKEYSSGDTVISEDDTSRDVFIIFNGWLSVEVRRPKGYSSCKIQVLKSSGIIGELSFLDGLRRTASVISMEDVKCLRLPYQKLQNLIDNDSNIGYHLINNMAIMLCSKMRNTNFELRNQVIW